MLLLSYLPFSVAAPPTTTAKATSIPVTPKCTTGERVRLQCTVKGGKQLALCQGEKGLTYRFGKDTAELVSDGPFTASRVRSGEDAETHTVAFEREGHTYAVVSDRTEDQFEARIEVAKDGVRIASIPCTTIEGVDFTELKLPAPANAAYVGTWGEGESTLTITQKDGGLHVEGESYWHGANPGQIHIGEVNGPLTLDGDEARYSKDGCTLTAQIRGTALWVEDDKRCGGVNVTFDGTYTRGTP